MIREGKGNRTLINGFADHRLTFQPFLRFARLTL